MVLPLLIAGAVVGTAWIVGRAIKVYSEQKTYQSQAAVLQERAKNEPYIAAAQTVSPADDIALTFRELKTPLLIGAMVIGAVLLIPALMKK